MIKKWLLILAFIIAPMSAFAASFDATVDSADITAGDSFTLRLELSGAQAKSDPDTAALNQDFDIEGQAETSETSIVNGSVKSSVGWQLTLLARKTGHVILPPVTIDTDAGKLSTRAIALTIGGSSAQAAQPLGPAANSGVQIVASVSDSSPYRNQPVVYTVHVIFRADASDVSLGEITADHAIIQPQGKPVVTDSEENGVPVKVGYFHFLVTPMQSGDITINPAVIQGSVVSRSRLHFGMSAFDPFGMLQNFPGFASMQPFSIASNAVTLHVKPPAVAMDPWLPLNSLKIEEKLEGSSPYHVGDSITRTVTLVANGVGGSQLPSLESQQKADGFHIYADKPVTEGEVDPQSGEIKGRRAESYTLIPVSAGHLTLPAIRVPWWDLGANRIAYAELPARELDILPAAGTATAAPPPVLAPVPQSGSITPAPVKAVQALPSQPALPLWLWGILAAFFLALIVMAIIILRLQKRFNGRTPSAPRTEENPDNRTRHAANIDWQNIRTAQTLNDAMLTYAHANWGSPRHGSLNFILSGLCNSDPALRRDIEAACRTLDAALYGGKNVNLEQLKTDCRTILSKLKIPGRSRPRDIDTLTELNPS